MYLGTPTSITEPPLPHSVHVESDLHRCVAVDNGRMPHPRTCSTSSNRPINHPSVPQAPDFASYQTDKEAILLSFYFDCVFDFQFPFYKRPSSTSSRGWLLSLLAERGPPYFASIALSAAFQQFMRPEEAIAGYSRDEAFQDAQGYQNIAIRGLRDQLDSYMMAQEAGGCDPRTCVRLLFSILQLIFASVRNFSAGNGCNADHLTVQTLKGENHTWRIHLEAASRLTAATPILFEHLMNQSVAPSQAPLPSHGSSGSDDRIHGASPRAVVGDPDVDFLTGAMVWLDIMTCASLRSKPCLSINRAGIHQLNKIDFSRLTGCPNWVMSSIMKICHLDKWRDDQEREGKLSIPKLVERANLIETELKFQSFEAASPLRLTGYRATTAFEWNPTQQISDLITPVFVSSALTYLHVVVSGPHPNLPETRESVSKTITKLQGLPNTIRMRFVAWPLCVSGCMATEDDYRFFTETMSKGEEIDEPASPSTRQAFRIMRECWRLRSATGGKHDWTSAMSKLGCQFLLL
jgi:C6 transcription factor Pro1